MTDGSRPKPFKLIPVLLWLALGILFILFAFVASLPSIISSEWGKKKLFSYLKAEYGIEVSCQRLVVQWFGHLEVTALKLFDETRKMTFNCDIIKTEADLWDVLFKKDFGHLYLDRLYVKITPSLLSLFPSLAPKADGMQRASLMPLGKGQELLLHFSLPYVGTLNCTFGKVEVLAEGVEPIVFDAIAMNVENSLSEHAMFAHVECTTLQKGAAGKMHIDAACTRMNTDSPIIKAKANLSQLPIQGLDELLSLFEPQYSGLLVNALGNTADLSLNGAWADGNFQIDLSTSSPLLSGQLAMATESGMVSLKQPAEFAYTLTPAFFRTLAAPRAAALSLQSDGTVRIALTQFSSAIPHSVNDLIKASFDAEVSSPSNLSFVCNEIPMSLSGLNLHIASVKGSMQCDGKASLESDRTRSSCNMRASYNPLTHDAQFAVQISDLPTDVIGQIAAIPFLSSYLGSSITINASGIKDKNNLLRLEMHSPLFTLQKAVFDLSDRLTLRSPVGFSYALTPESMQTLAKEQIAQAVMVQGRINAFSLPLQGSMQNAELDLEATLDRLELDGTEPIVIENATMGISAHTLDHISLTLTSNTLRAHAAGKYQWKTGKCTLVEPLTITAAIDNTLLHRLAIAPATLLKPVDMKFVIDPFSFTPALFSMQALALKGSATIDQLAITPFAGSPEISMQNLSIPFQWDGPQKTAVLGLSANVQEKAQLETLPLSSLVFKSAFSDVQWGKWEKVSATALLEVQKMPAAFADSLVGKALFSPLLGPEFSTTLKIQSSPQEQNLGLNLTSSLVNLKSAFTIQGNSLTLAGPAQIQWTLTPEGYKALDRCLIGQKQAAPPLGFELKEPSRFQVSIAKLEIPLAAAPGDGLYSRIPDVNLDLSMLQLIGEGSNPSISLFDSSSNEAIAVSSLGFSFNKSQNVPLTFACEANVASQGKSNSMSKTGSISLKGAIDHFFDEKGQLDLQGLSSEIALQVKSFPSRLLDLLARLKGRTDYPFTKIFGNTIQATLKTSIKNLSGPVTLNLNSPNVRFSLDAIASNGALLLEQPIYAQMKITKEMSTLFLKEVNPLGIHYFYSENPVTVEIPAKGFYLPLHPFNLKLLTIPSARIEMGKIACRNEGNINIALGLLRTKQFEKNKEMLLWFAPIDLHAGKGIVEMERTEILLAETYDIALWGEVDLVDNYVDMLLGLTSQTLSKAFKIQDLPDDYVLTIPMQGPMDSVQINSTKATAKIGLLLAAQHKALQDSLGKSKAGAILGGLIKGMAALPDNGKVPPAKHPFPWEKSTSHIEDEDRSQEKMVHFKQNEKPLKQLIKVIK